MTTLYRKYRPQDFSQVVGQEIIVKTLQNALLHSIPAHSYLFTGPRGTGKTSLARIFAKVLNCQKRTGAKACNKCAHCLAVEDSQSLDIIEIDAASYTGVDNIRSLRETMTNTPLLGKYKIYIIDEVHMLSIGAFNALLKIMEEPPEHVIFLLATTELHKVPKTILSRCQRFDLRKFTLSEIVGKLKTISKSEGIKIDTEALTVIAKNSGGALRDAESLLTQVQTLAEGGIDSSFVRNMLGISDTDVLFSFSEGYCDGDLEKILLAIKKVEDGGKSPIPLTQEIIALFRNILLYKAHKKFDIDPLTLLSQEEQSQVSQAGEKCSYEQLTSLLESLEEAIVKMKNSTFGFLPLEIAFAQNIPEKSGNDSDLPPSPTAKKSPAETKKTVLSEASEKSAGVSSKSALTPPESSDSQLSLKMIEEKWEAIIEKVKFLNASLSVALQNAVPHTLHENTLHIGVKYKFHQERLSEPAHQLTLQTAFDTILGTHLGFRITDAPHTSPSKKAEEADPLVQHALKLLGGTVI